MEEISIRKASADDVSSLLALGRQTYLETFGPYNTKENSEAYMNKAFTTGQLTEELTSRHSQWYLALSGNEKAGYLKVNFNSAQTELQDEKAMEIERIYVLQKYHRKGIGKLLLEKALAIARQHHMEYVWLGVWERNANALSFYNRQGFERFSQHSFFIGDDEQTDWMMKLPLRTPSGSAF